MAGAGSALALVAAASWAGANLAIKKSGERFGSWAALVWAQITGCGLAIGAALLIDGPPRWPDARTLTCIVGAGIAACLAYTGLFQAFRLGRVSVVSPILSGWSLIAVVISALFFAMPLSPLAIGGVLLVVAGNATLATLAADDGDAHRSALVWAFAGSLGMAVMMPLIDQAGLGLSRLWVVPAVWMVDLVIGVPILWRLGMLQRRPRTFEEWRMATSVGALEVGGAVAVSVAFAYAEVAVVAPIASLNTAATVALGLFLLRERIPRKALAGAVAASCGVVLLHL